MTPREKAAILDLLRDAQRLSNEGRPWAAMRCIETAVILMRGMGPREVVE